MTSQVMLWAGKRLTPEEEAATRRMVVFLAQAGDVDAARHHLRFLPEELGSWSPEDLELGARTGPWTGFGATASPD